MSTQLGSTFAPKSAFQFMGNSSNDNINTTNNKPKKINNPLINGKHGKSKTKNPFSHKSTHSNGGKLSQFQKDIPKPKTTHSSNVHEINENIGPLINNPESMGFIRVNHKKRDLPKFLITQQPQLVSRKFEQDHWDKLNQKKMNNLEKTIDDTTELYETLKKMRDTERTMMENKGLVDKADLAKDLNEAIVFQGTCLDMCPVFERSRRNVEFTVFSYERDKTDDKKASRSKALKVFARPAAAAAPPLPSDVRPPHILMKTLDYIVDNLLTTLPKSEGFLWDRMRSIRQDFTYQNYSGPEAVDCNERIVRIHLLILHVMIKTKTEFSIQQELEQLHKSLITLSEIYDDMRANGFYCPNEAEFRAYALLSKIRDPQYDQTIQELPSHIFNDNLVQLAIAFRQIVSNSNYVERGYIKTENSLNFYLRFFQLLESQEVPFLLGSFLQIYLGEIRFYAMRALSITLNKKHKPIPYEFFINSLKFNNNEELETFCNYYSITVSEQTVDLKSLNHHSHRLTEKKPLGYTYLQCVDNKINNRPYAQIINSGKSNMGIGKNEFSNEEHNQSNMTAPILNQFASNTPSIPPLPTLSNVLSKSGISFTEKAPVLNPIPTEYLKTNENNLPQVIQPQGISNKKEVNIFTSKPNPLPQISSTPQNQVSFNFPTSVKKEAPIPTSFEIPKKSVESTFIPLSLSNTPSVNESLSNSKEQEDIALKKQKIKKQQQKEQLKTRVAESVTNDIINSITSNIVKDIVTENKKAKENKAAIINTLANSLFNAFLHENMYNAFLLSKATVFQETRKKKSVFCKWKGLYESHQLQKKERKKHIEDLQNVQNQLGVPQIKRSRYTMGTPVANSNNSFLLTSDRKNNIIFSPTYNEYNNFSSQLEQNEDVWKAFDLKKIYFDKVRNRIYPSLDIEIDILLYSHNWLSISNDWLLKKFGLDSYEKTLTIKENNLKLNVKCTDYNFDPENMDHVQLIVFNTGVTTEGIFDLDLKLQKDGEELIKLITNVSARSEFCFNLLIVYWDSTETRISSSNISRYLKLNRIEKSFNDVLLNIGFITVTGDSPHKSLEEGLERMSRDFKCQLTERGRYKQKIHKRRVITGSQVTHKELNTLATIDEKMKRIRKIEDDIYKQQQDNKNTYAHLQTHMMASPRLHKSKLPVLLSASKSNTKFKTPIPTRNVSSSTPPIPSHLVSKVQRGHQHGIPPGTPCQSTNFPNMSLHVHQTPIVRRDIINSGYVNMLGIDEGNQHVFRTPVQAIVKPIDQSLLSVEQSREIQELKSIIETVRKKVHSDYQ